MTLDITKPVQTKDGRIVEILRSNINNPDYPVVGIVTDGSHQHVETYTADGFVIRNDSQSRSNLVNMPVYGYKLVYDDGIVVPAGTGASSWLNNKEMFCDYDRPGRLGFLKRDPVSLKVVFEPL